MNVVASPGGLTQNGSGAGHVLNLDGQADTDYYTIYTTGSHGNVRNYVIDVLDTGAPNDGRTSWRSSVWTPPTRRTTATSGTRPTVADDIFLLRSNLHRQPEPVRRHRCPRPCCTLPHGVRRPPGLRRAAGRRRQQRRRHRAVPRPGPGQRAEQPRPEDQLRHRAQRPGQRLRHGRQRRLLRRRHQATMTLDGGAGQRHLPDRPDLRHAARRRPCPPTAAHCCRRHLPVARRDHARLAEPGHARTAAGHRWHRQRPVHRLREPGRDPAQRRRPQRPVHRPCLRDRRGVRHSAPTTTPTATSADVDFRPAGGVFPRSTATRVPPRHAPVDPDLHRDLATSASTTTATASATTPTRTSPTTTPPAATSTSTTRSGSDDVIPLDANGVGRPGDRPGLLHRAGRSTSAPAAARTRCSTTSTRRSTSTAAPASTSSSSSAPSSPTTSSITNKAHLRRRAERQVHHHRGASRSTVSRATTSSSSSPRPTAWPTASSAGSAPT